jgi:hypothetical protein
MIWYGDDRRIVLYPCSDNQLLNFVGIHPDTESHATKNDGKGQTSAPSFQKGVVDFIQSGISEDLSSKC